MSHTTHERMRELVAAIRAVEASTAGRSASWSICRGRSCGSAHSPAAPVMLKKGDTFVLDSDPAPGDATRVHLPHPEIFAAVEPGHTLLLDDGKVRLTAHRGRPERASSPASRSAANCRTARA